MTTRSSRSTIPPGAPYGQRKATKEAFQAAGVPTTQRDPSPNPPGRPRSSPLQQAPEYQPEIDGFALRQPSPGFEMRPTEESRVVALLEASSDPLLANLGYRLRSL